MNGKKARALRKMATVEMYSNKENVPRELVVARIKGHDRVINEPMSTRAMYLRLKTAYGVALRRQA
jgi:hypothetical protein